MDRLAWISLCPGEYNRCYNDVCCKCNCRNKTQQCVAQENGWLCNCTGTGYHGPKCECQDTLCDDVYGMLKNCTEFTTRFVTLNEIKYSEHGKTKTAPSVFNGVSSLADCVYHSVELQCQFATLVGQKCTIYAGTAAIHGGQFQHTDAHTTVVRECRVCN
ncbi:uncharacterized protein LOC123532759 isoform X2 [Mercenaria mercenaria]|uniref:uncharacterized protein LOC123532759 isoform X2 n=1 Tax=Mercenaria mercenaria TaxID=6596 RepID=UPI00234E7945|nr:uncharacterized protein LOC123532759 isoform X2 [Mercenaria mercenaria]